MALKVSTGTSRKLGLPDYGSLGASCFVEFELDASLLQSDLDAFHQHVRNAYVACRQAVNDELARNNSGNSTPAVPPQQAAAVEVRSTATTARPNGNGRNGRVTTPKQLTYIQQLTAKIAGLDAAGLETLAGKMFGKQLGEMSTLDASQLIEVLKSIRTGDVDLQAALNGAAQ